MNPLSTLIPKRKRTCESKSFFAFYPVESLGCQNGCFLFTPLENPIKLIIIGVRIGVRNKGKRLEIPSRMSSEDVAVGVILMSRYRAIGDIHGFAVFF